MAANSTAGTEIQVGDIRLKKASYYCSCWNGVGKSINTHHFLNPLGYFQQSPKVKKVGPTLCGLLINMYQDSLCIRNFRNDKC